MLVPTHRIPEAAPTQARSHETRSGAENDGELFRRWGLRPVMAFVVRF